MNSPELIPKDKNELASYGGVLQSFSDHPEESLTYWKKLFLSIKYS